MGLKGATSSYACLWYKVHKDKRWETDKSFDFFNAPPMVRTLTEIQEMAKKSKDNYCCQLKPFLNFLLDHVIVDELHLLLRVTDVMLDNIITEVVDWDKEDDFEKKAPEAKGVHLKRLISSIKSCGVGFEVWERRNPADSKGTGKYEWTSLFGNDKKKVLTSLPEKLPGLVRPETRDKISHLWVTFRKIYREINDWSPDNSIHYICCEVQDWINTFVSLRGHRVGYERKRVTPYMHILFAHVPHFLASFQSLKIFTGQGVEKNNDTARSAVLHKSNNYDCGRHRKNWTQAEGSARTRKNKPIIHQARYIILGSRHICYKSWQEKEMARNCRNSALARLR